MFQCKSDLDRHVEFCLKGMQTESERNLRCFTFAKLYFNIGEYELSRRYISSYLISKPKSSEAQLWLGKILEKLGRREAALEAYRTSLDIDPKQNGLVLKVCELLAYNDVTLDATRARFWSEQAQLLDPQHPAVFNLRARLAAADSTGPDDVRQLFLSELEHRPTDVALRVRLLQHLLDNNQLTDAYHHVAEIENKNLTIFADHLVWYETVATILLRYRNENTASNAVLTWEFWMLIVSVLDRLVGLCLDENITTSKNLSECVKALFNLDQTLTIAAENINASCTEKQLAQEFLIHYRAQLCFHIAVLLFKQAKKDQIKYAEAVKLCIPLLLASYHSAPVELQCVWLEHAGEASRQRAAAWHRAAAHRCSQAGHVLLGLARERRSSFSDRAQQLMAGAWRERTIKNIFITRDQQLKIKTSYFVSCPQLDEIVSRLPDQTELLRYDEVAQLVHPGSLHHAIWIGLNNNDPVNFRCSVFDGLQYSVRNLNNCAAETLNVLDIQAFLYCCIFCAQANIEESKHLIYYNSEKPAVLPAAITEPYGSLNQTKWYSSVYKVYKNEYGASLSDVRVTLLKGIEVVRCAGAHGLDAKLLVLLANTFAARAKKLTKSTEIEATEARADLYWRTALPLLEKLRNNQALSYLATRWFEYRAKEITPTELNMYIEEGKLFSAQQLMKKKDHEKALQLLSTLKNPYASFYQAQTYKLLSDEQMSHNKESVTSEMRSQHIILLSKARDCFYLTLDRLREPAVDRKHPLNAELGTEIEKIERLLSRIDPDTVNRNECDGMSDENLSSVGSVGETGGGYAMMHHTTYHNGTGMSSTGHGGLGPTTPRHEPHHSTLLGRREARPSPERLDAQLRQMAAAKDAAVAHILDQNRLVMDAHRTLVDEIRGFKDAVTGLTASVNELRDIKHSVDELKIAVDDLQNMKEAVEQVYEIKKDLAELKKDTNKLKSSQINEEDLYALEEEYGVDYNINTAGASGFNSAAALYPNLQQRFQNTAANTLAYGAPGLYPSLYPMYPYGGLSLGQPAALPFPDGHVPDFRAMQPPPAPLPANLFGAKVPAAPTDATAAYKFDNANLALNTVPAQLLQPTVPAVVPAPAPAPIIPQVPLNKAPPVNVVITTSDPLPTTSAAQPVLSVTIPPQHLKGNQPPKVAHQPHNYQIPLPVTTQPTFSNVHSTITSTPMPVSTQNLLSNVAPPVYSSLTVNSPNQAPGATNKGLGLQIEKSLAQNFTTPNTSELNKSNVSEGSVLEEHDPCPDFKPIIPLPDEVPVNTGEEGERVLFSIHAKLYRFMEREWRERGIGTVKLLYNEASGKVRVLMRRDQVHKICANHFLAPDMQLTPMQKNERAYIWAANDFADENVVLEKFCIRFKTPEEGKKFAEAFEHAKTLLKTEATKQNLISTATESKKPETPKDISNSLGGFVFTSTPTFKPKTDLKTDTPAKQTIESTTAKPSPFASFTFGTPKSTPTSEFKPVQKLDIAPTPKDLSLVSPKPVVKQQTSVTEEHEEDEDFTPTTEFKPVIPLPDLIEVKTGEENSEVLYEVKAKLLRFDGTAKEWKERGVGNIKILKDKTIRLLMRREQVHKVCCNHQLLKSMVFTNMPKNNRVLNWCAQDYAENVLKTEMFAIRFRTAELCEEFLQMIHKAQDMLDSSNNVSSAAAAAGVNYGSGSGDATSSGWGEKYKPKVGSWECSMCYVSNTDKYTCIACGSSREEDASAAQDNAQSPQKFKPSPPAPVFIDKSPKPKVGTWQCKVCFIHNDGKNHYCEACDSPKNDTVAKKDASVDLNASGAQFSFGSVTPNFGSPASAPVSSTTSNWGDLFKPKVGAWECKACYISNDGSASYCIACESPKDDTVPKKENKGIDLGTGGSEQKFTFGIPVATKPTTSESIFGGKSQISAGFTFGMNQISTPPTTGFSFGVPTTGTEAPPVSGFTFDSVQKPTTPVASEPLNLVAPGKATFTFSLNKTTEIKPPQDEFIFGSPQKHDFEFKPRSPRKVSGSGDGEDSDSGEIEEECDNIYFKPVIPLPDKVEVRTGEEDETVLYCHRSKLFRFTNGEWKERGIGDVKILRHPVSNKLRVLMRREQVHKICLNHSLSKDIEYKAKDDHTWLFTAPDYSDGEITYQQFCLRFKNAEIATQFINAVEKARNEDVSTTAEIDSIPKIKVESNTSDPDLEIVYEVKVSPELQEKALKLQLPKNFYAYLEKEPCKGCIGCNDDNFIFSITKPKTETIESTTKVNAVKSDTSIFASPASSIFGTPKTGIFSGNNSTTSGFETPKSTISSTGSTFSFGSQSKSFSSPFGVTTTTPSTTNIFSTPTSQPTNIFGKSGSMIFGSTTITPVINDAPTLTSLLTQSQHQPTPQASQPSEHKSPLAPSKLGTVLSTSASTGSIFSGAPPAQPTANIFGGKPSTPSTPPLSQMLSSNKTGAIFGNGNSIFGGVKSETNIFSGSAVKTEASSNIFGNFGSTTTTASIFGGTGSGSVFSTPAQPVFGNNFSFTQPDKPSIFGNLSNTSSFGSIAAQQNKDAELVLKCDTNLTFAALASENQNQSFTATEIKGETKPFSFAGAGSLVFGGQKSKTENKTSSEKLTDKDKSITTAEGDEEEGAGGGGVDAEGEDNYDPHYEPIVPLPDAIVVKTGEEDETVVFNERAKLYRYTADTKEWKERGVGQLKLLYHPGHGTHRLLLRREQVHKLVLNQLVTADLDLQPMHTSDRAWCWAGYNHVEEGGVLEQLAVRFKTPELASLFKEMVRRALDELANKPPSTLTDTTPHDTAGDEEDTHDEEDPDNEDDEQEDEYGSEDSDENRTIMFCKRCTLSYKSDEGAEWAVLGMGVIKMLYDSEMYGGRVEMIDDTGAILSNTIVAINTVMKVEDTNCTWRAMEWSLASPVPRILRAQFSSAAAAQEMYYNYEEALQYAQHSEIVDNLPQ